MKHTPAPWKIEGKYTYHAIFGGHNNNRLVAEVPEDANAALIAAAPELLEALQAMVRIVTRTPMVDLPEVAQAVHVIAKTTESAA